jgi:hypothetical protein
MYLDCDRDGYRREDFARMAIQGNCFDTREAPALRLEGWSEVDGVLECMRSRVHQSRDRVYLLQLRQSLLPQKPAAACPSHSQISRPTTTSFSLQNTQFLHTDTRSSSLKFRHYDKRLHHSTQPLQSRPSHSYVMHVSDGNNHTDLNQKPTQPPRHHHGSLGPRTLRVRPRP